MFQGSMLRGLLIVLALSSGLAAGAAADSPRPIDIPAGDLVEALETLTRQANVSLVYEASQLTGLHTRGVSGNLTAQQAVAGLIQGTPLKLRVDSATGAMLIEPVKTHTGSTGMEMNASPADGAGGSGGPAPVSVRELRLAQSESAGTAGSSPPEPRTPESRLDSLDEVVVTAQKQAQRLQDVPVPVTALNADRLLEGNQLRLQDYFTDVPGLNFTPDNRGNASLAIRGITTGIGVGNPTVGVVVDDVPYGPSSTYGAGGISVIVPDIDPGDLERVEILRGPQGTLYGASSIGGLLKFVTVDPSPSGVSGRVQAGISSVQNGASPGYNVRGSVNVPLGETLAIRASGFEREDPGYIDNIRTGQRDVNRVDVDGGRLAALWRPSDVFSIKASALYQESKGYGLPYSDPALGDLRQDALADSGVFDEKASVYSATLTAKFGEAVLTAVSGYSMFSYDDAQDWTGVFGSLTQQNYGVGGTLNRDEDWTHKFSEEIRLSMPLGSRLDWLLGGFDTHENSQAHQQWQAVDLSTVAVAGTFLNGSWPTAYGEYAAFTDLTVHVTDQFDLQIGGRESTNRQTYSEVDGADYGLIFLGVAGPVVTPEVVTKDSSFTYLVTPQYRLSPDLMLYARLASGYRPGGPNPVCSAFDLPCHFEPDKTKNYELGLKGDLLDRALSFDASLYYIDWKDIQLSVFNIAGSFYTNAGGAKSEGLELSMQGRPAAGLTLGGWAAWDRAVLTQNFPESSTSEGMAGDRLPDSPRFSGNLSIEQQGNLSGRWSAIVGGELSYVGDRIGPFNYTALRQYYPGYAKLDGHAALRRDSWKISFTVNNAANRRGVLAGGLASVNPANFDFIEPRTLGLSISKTFLR